MGHREGRMVHRRSEIAPPLWLRPPPLEAIMLHSTSSVFNLNPGPLPHGSKSSEILLYIYVSGILLCIHVYVHMTNKSRYICIYVCTRNVCVCIYVYTFIYFFVPVFTDIHTCIHTYIHTYIHTHINTYTHTTYVHTYITFHSIPHLVG